MAIGKRIRFFRLRKRMTQKQLGELLGFVEKTSEVRIAQYESETRIPKQDLINDMARYLGVSDKALTVPEIDTYIGLMHTLFAIEDIYGFKIDEKDGKPCLLIDSTSTTVNSSVSTMLDAWLAEARKYEAGEITKEAYDKWRYNYPKHDTHQIWAKVPSQELSDILVAAFKEKK